MTQPTPPVNQGNLHEASHTLIERVYFEHTDFSGIVYHARYLDFLEHGRSDYVRLLGVHHSAMRDGSYGESLAFAVHRMEIDFRRAARIDDVLTIENRSWCTERSAADLRAAHQARERSAANREGDRRPHQSGRKAPPFSNRNVAATRRD